MQRVEQMPAAERGGDRQREALGKAHQRRAGRLRPAAAADQHDRALGRPQQLLQPAHVGQARPGLDRLERRGVGHRDALGQHVLRQRDHHRAGPAAGRRCGRRATTISGMRAGSSISVAHLAIEPNTAR